MSDRPTISVIIPAYNAAPFVGRAIESALAQTYAPLEILVVDDGSTDETALVVAQFPAPVCLLRQDNAGPAAARNHGAREAKGEWLALLDADDVWLPEKLERQSVFADDPHVGLIRCFREGQLPDDEAQREITFERLWERNCIANSSVLVRRSAFEAVNGFDEDRTIISVEDYNLWLRIVRAGWKVATCPEALWRYTPAQGSLSRQTERFARAELRNVEKIGELLKLPADALERKKNALYNEYGRELLHYRQVRAARCFLRHALSAQPSALGLAWWLATFLPVPLLDWRRHQQGR